MLIAVLTSPAQCRIVERRYIACPSGGAFDDVNKCKLQRRELFDQLVEQALGVAVLLSVVDRRDRRQAQSRAACTDLTHDGGYDLDGQSCPIFLGPAIGIGTVVDAVAKKLLQQVAIGAVHLDAIKAGGNRMARGVRVGCNDPRQLVKAQRTWRGRIFESLGCKSLRVGSPRCA